MLWINEVEIVCLLEELKSPRSVCSRDVPNFEMLHAKIASALKKIIRNSHLKKKVSLEEPKAQKEDLFLRGTQIAFMIYDYFRVAGAHDTVMYFADCSLSLFIMTMFRKFDTRLDEVFMSKMPSDDVLESLRKLRKRESAQLKTVLELYDMEIHQKLRLRNFDVGNERIEIRAAVTISKGQRGVGRGQGECHQWKEKKDSGREETCSFRHDEDRMVTNVQWLFPVGLRISGHRAPGIFIDFTAEPNSLGINSTSAIHKSCAASWKHPRKWSAARKIQLKIPHQRSP